MSLPNLTSCKPGEYSYYQEERIMEKDLSIKGLYTLMFQLRSGNRARDFKCPSEVVGRVLAASSGLHAIRFNLLDVDFKPIRELKGPSSDGYFQTSELGVDMVSYFRDLSSLNTSDLHETSVPVDLRVPEIDLAA